MNMSFSGIKLEIMIIILLLISLTAIRGSASDLSDGNASPDNPYYTPTPANYVHRPIIEFFTGLSCPSCMSGPHPDMEDIWNDNFDDPEQPFTYVVFHELNGGGVDDLATDETKERMRHYQPGVSGTPDANFDGGYIELGGMTGGSLDKSTALQAIEDCKTRYERNINPLRPFQSIRNDFKYVELFVDQVFTGDGFAVNVEAKYLGTEAFLPLEQLSGSLYVFMVEEGVEAYSTVEERTVVNRNVFRGYAMKDQQFTLANGDSYTTTVEWDIPDAKIPVRPGNITAVAAVYDLDDTSSQEGNQGNSAQVPRCIQSATPRSTAFDRENDIPVISNANGAYNDGVKINAKIDDDNGISMAYVLYNFEASNATVWNSVEMNITGEEICDDSGVCYAYGESTAIGSFKAEKGATVYYMILAYDGSGIDHGGLGAQGTSEIYSYNVAGGGSGSGGDRGFSIETVGWILGVCFLIFLLCVFFFGARKGQGDDADGSSSFRSRLKNKRVFYSFIIIIILALGIFSIYALSRRGGEQAPEFTLTDIDGKEFSLSDHEGKVVVIDFMAVSCGPCNDAMPDLRSVYNEYEDDIVMISIDVWDQENEDQLRGFKEKHKADWIFAMDTDDLRVKYNVIGVPKVVIIDEEGGVTFSREGSVSRSKLSAEVGKAIHGGAPLTSLGSSSLGLLGFTVLVGIGSFFSPCSFPLLPGYMSYYMGLEKSRSIHKALIGGAAASLGLILVYVLLGIVVGLGGSAITPYIPILEPFVGFIIVILGVVMLTNYVIPFYRISDPIKKLFSRNRERGSLANKYETAQKKGYVKLFWYGTGYAGAAAGCTAPLLLGVTLAALASGSFLEALLIFVVLAAVMAVLMIFVTLLIAMSAGTLLQKLKVSTVWIKRISGVILVVVGVYLIAFYMVAF